MVTPELGLEDVQYVHGDLRIKKSIGGLNISAGVKHRQHPVYGFDAAILDTTWYRGQWWNFAEDALVLMIICGDPTMQDEDGNWLKQQLYEYDPVTGELREIEGAGPLWNEGGEYWGT